MYRMENKNDQHPSQIPLNDGRIAAVAEGYRKTADENRSEIDKLSQKEADIKEDRQKAVILGTVATILTARKENKFWGLGRLFGKKQRQEKEQPGEADITAADFALDQSQKSMKTALDQERHAVEKLAANQLGGPVETSSKMTETLKQQDPSKVQE